MPNDGIPTPSQGDSGASPWSVPGADAEHRAVPAPSGPGAAPQPGPAPSPYEGAPAWPSMSRTPEPAGSPAAGYPDPPAYGSPVPGQQGAYPPGGGYPQAPYGAGYPPVPQGRGTDGVSIAALVTGVLMLGLVPLVLGIVGLGRTKRNGTQGRGFAIAGIVLGVVGIIAGIVITVGVIVGIGAYNGHLDDLHAQCAAGDMAACDQLYRQSGAGSSDERFGATCGNRISGGGNCQEAGAFTYGDDPVLDRLWDACAGGDGAACDELYDRSAEDTDYEAFANTCGNRVEFAMSCEETIGR